MKVLLVSILLPLIVVVTSSIAQEIIDFQIKGTDNGIKSNREQDYKEALLDAKMKALAKAGIEINTPHYDENTIYFFIKFYVSKNGDIENFAFISYPDLSND